MQYGNYEYILVNDDDATLAAEDGWSYRWPKDVHPELWRDAEAEWRECAYPDDMNLMFRAV